MSTSRRRAAKWRAVSPDGVAARNWSWADCDNNSLHIDWLPASTARRSGIFPFCGKIFDSNEVRYNFKELEFEVGEGFSISYNLILQNIQKVLYIHFIKQYLCHVPKLSKNELCYVLFFSIFIFQVFICNRVFFIRRLLFMEDGTTSVNYSEAINNGGQMTLLTSRKMTLIGYKQWEMQFWKEHHKI